MVNDTNPKPDEAAPKGEVPPSAPPPPSPPSVIGGEHRDIKPPHENRPPAQEGRPPREPIRITDWLIAIFTIVIAAGTVVQGVIFYESSRDSSTQTDKLIFAANTQAQAAQRFSDSAAHLETTISAAESDLNQSAANAKASIKATQDAMKLDQRAWVGVIETDAIHLNPGDKSSVGVTVANSGKTPAINFHSMVAIRSFAKDQEFFPDYNAQLTEKPGQIVIQPGMHYLLRTQTTVLTQLQVDTLKSGAHILYFYGKMSYDDTFHHTHHSTFCLFWRTDFSYSYPCSIYNTAD